MKRGTIVVSSAAFTACALATGAHAQTTVETTEQEQGAESADGIAPIIVTAQRRAENVQDTPVAVTAVGAEAIERRMVIDIDDIAALSPGVSIGQQSGFARIYIRGVGAGSFALGNDNSVAVHMDGVPIGRPFAQLSGYFDVERIEVLRGPQGTLYGRNATGGAINIIARRPSREFSGNFDVLYGNYNQVRMEAGIGGPLTDDGDVRARLAVQHNSHDGFDRNVTLGTDINDRNTWAGRLSIDIDPAPGVDIKLTADYSREDDNAFVNAYLGQYRADTPNVGLGVGGTALPGSRDVASDVSYANDRKFWGLNATIGIDVSDAIRFQSITGYRDSQRLNTTDVDGTSAAVLPITIIEDAKQFSQEMQFTYSSDRVEGIVGLFYYDESAFGSQNGALPVVGRTFGFDMPRFYPRGDLRVEALAAFTQWTVEPIDNLKLTAGIRYSDETRAIDSTFGIFNFDFANPMQLNIPVAAKRSWNALTPRFSIHYSPDNDLLFYVSATRGFKSGILLIGLVNPPVDPEYIWAYEGGVKSTFLDGRLQLNAAGFYYDFTNLQVNRNANNTVITENAASASIKGFELETRANPAKGVMLDANVTYLDAKYGDYQTIDPGRVELGTIDLSGSRLPYAARWSFNAGAEVDIPVNLPGRLSVRGDVEYSGRLYFTEFNVPVTSQDKYALVDASIQYESDSGWQFGTFVRNLTNIDVRNTAVVASGNTGFAMITGYLAPRTYGVRAGYKF